MYTVIQTSAGGKKKLQIWCKCWTILTADYKRSGSASCDQYYLLALPGSSLRAVPGCGYITCAEQVR